LFLIRLVITLAAISARVLHRVASSMSVNDRHLREQRPAATLVKRRPSGSLPSRAKDCQSEL